MYTVPDAISQFSMYSTYNISEDILRGPDKNQWQTHAIYESTQSVMPRQYGLGTSIEKGFAKIFEA